MKQYSALKKSFSLSINILPFMEYFTVWGHPLAQRISMNYRKESMVFVLRQCSHQIKLKD